MMARMLLAKYIRCSRPAVFKFFNSSFSSKSSESFISLESNEKLQTVTMNLQRPPVNSLNLEFLEQITSTIKDLEKSGVKGLILTSKTQPVFSAGLDIMEMYNVKPERLEKFWRSLQEMWKTLYTTPLITIAAINGHAPAGGCLMSMSCDYKVMLDGKFTIGLNETLLGLTAPKWFRDLYVSTVGFRKAEKALFLGTLFTPQQALSMNLVDDLAANEAELNSKVEEQMKIWLKIPSIARKNTKSEMRQPAIQKFESYRDEEIQLILHYILSESVQGALKKYLEMLKSKSSK